MTKVAETGDGWVLVSFDDGHLEWMQVTRYTELSAKEEKDWNEILWGSGDKKICECGAKFTTFSWSHYSWCPIYKAKE